jgi:hypothetical protein
MRRRTLRRRYGRAKAGSGKVQWFRVVAAKYGPEAWAYDYRGRTVNAINGVWGEDTVESVRRAARKHWPDAKDKTP